MRKLTIVCEISFRFVNRVTFVGQNDLHLLLLGLLRLNSHRRKVMLQEQQVRNLWLRLATALIFYIDSVAPVGNKKN